MRHVSAFRAVLVLAICCSALHLGLAQANAGAAEPDARARHLELLELAPKGTWAVHVTDFTQIPADANYYLTTRGCAGPTFPGTTLYVGFCLPAEDEAGSDIPVCGVTRVEGVWASDIAQALKRVSETMEVEGMDAYDMSDGPFVALAGDRTLLTGSTKSALGKMIKAYCDRASRGMDPDVRRLIEPFIGRAVYSCGLAPPTVRSPESEILGLQPVGGCVGGTRDIDVTKGYALRASFMTAGPGQAAQAAERARALVRSVIHDLRKSSGLAFWAPERAEARVLEGVSVLPQGSEVRAEVVISGHELKKLPEHWESDFYNSLFSRSESVTFSQPSAERDSAGSWLYDISQILWLYAVEHGDAYPESLAPLAEEGYLGDTQFFVQESDARVLLAWDGGTLWSYRYVGRIPSGTSRSAIIVYTAKDLFSGGRNVLCAGDRVAWVTEAELHDPGGPPSTSLRASYKAVVEAFGDQLTPERDAELRRFYEVGD